MEFPKHLALYMTHNDHKTNYESVEVYLMDMVDDYQDLFENLGALQQAIDTDEIWDIQWYPDTPVGFYRILAPTLEDALRIANGG